MFKKFKNYKFWMSLLAAVIVLINTLGTVFHFTVNEVAITSITTAVLGILVILGFVKKDEDETKLEDNEEQTKLYEDDNAKNNETENKDDAKSE